VKITIKTDYEITKRLMGHLSKQVDFAASLALNKTVQQARKDVQSEMSAVFHNPTRWVINSLRIKVATKQHLVAEVAFKDRPLGSSGRTMVAPHVYTGSREHKGMERSLSNKGLLPSGWFAVPAAGAKLDANGNMSRAQIKSILAAMGGETAAPSKRRRTTPQAAYFAAKKDDPQTRHLPPGIYARTARSIQPVLLFVARTAYRRRLDFYGIINKTVATHLPNEWRKAMDHAIRTAR
jgi:hypothetical protein